MKKLFVSVPMKGRTEEQIRFSINKMKTIAEATIGEELELIDSYVEDKPPHTDHEAVWYLGKSIQLLSQADYHICPDRSYEFPGCRVEMDVAEFYDIPSLVCPMQYVCPDVWEQRLKERKNGTSLFPSDIF